MTAADSHQAIPARKLIFWLFVGLALATAVSLIVFLNAMGDCDRDGIMDSRDSAVTCQRPDGDSRTFDGQHVRTIVYRAMAADLAAPVVAWFILAGIGAPPGKRWFPYSVALPAGIATAILVFLALHGLGEL